MKKVLIGSVIGLIVAAVIAGAILLNPQKGELGANAVSSNVLIGTPNALGLVTSTQTLADSVALSTTTATTSAITQLVNTEGYDKVLLNIKARGVSSTISTLYIRQMGSDDGTNYFDIAQSTTTFDKTVLGTTTVSNDFQLVQWLPGTATTSLSIPFETYGHRYTRFILWASAASTTNDGIYAYVLAVSVK